MSDHFYRNSGNQNSFHSQMRKNKHTFSSPAMRSKSKRYGYKVKTAMVRDSSDSQMNPSVNSNPIGLPHTGQRKDYNRNNQRMYSPEERKRSGSIASNGSIISTASSNSPDGKKSKLGPNSLQIAGQPMTLRKAGIRAERTPHARNQRNNLRNYNANDEHGRAMAALTLLNKKQNMSIDNRISYTDKKRVLENLNRQYRNKYL